MCSLVSLQGGGDVSTRGCSFTPSIAPSLSQSRPSPERPLSSPRGPRSVSQLGEVGRGVRGRGAPVARRRQGTGVHPRVVAEDEPCLQAAAYMGEPPLGLSAHQAWELPACPGRWWWWGGRRTRVALVTCL